MSIGVKAAIEEHRLGSPPAETIKASHPLCSLCTWVPHIDPGPRMGNGQFPHHWELKNIHGMCFTHHRMK
jgi:hypothetical protein